jgi:acyl dehydratase
MPNSSASFLPEKVHLRFRAKPANFTAILASILANRPRSAAPQTLPSFAVEWTGARVDAKKLAQYCKSCALPDCDMLPALYLHALAMPLHMAVLSHPRFPLRAAGLVHLANEMESYAGIDPGSELRIACTMAPGRESEKGQTVEFHTSAYVAEQLAWRECSTYLSPARRTVSLRARATPAQNPVELGPALAQWSVPADAGRRFASAAQDWNPIHLSALTARLFGYPRAIAHGMLGAGRCLGLLQQYTGIGHPMRMRMRFKRPLFLPGQLALYAAGDAKSAHFVLKAASGEPHLEGDLESLGSSNKIGP